MTATTAFRNPTQHLQSSLAIPLSQNTAPVHEFRCLFTHDIRRKNAKRWHDGTLRFHTFNKRVMVYDYPDKNFIGDSHLRDRSELYDGDEISLERCGALVQVGEKTGSVDTDLTPLLVREKRQAESNQERRNDNISTAAPGNVSSRGMQLASRPSNVRPQTPSKLTGRANISNVSPYEERNHILSAQVQPEGPPHKRRRNDENHVPLWEVLKTSKVAASKQKSTIAVTPSRAKPASRSIASSKNAPQDGQARLKVKEIVDITSSLPESASVPGGQEHLSSNLPPQVVEAPVTAPRPISPAQCDLPLVHVPIANQLAQVTGNNTIEASIDVPQACSEFDLDAPEKQPVLVTQEDKGHKKVRNQSLQMPSILDASPKDVHARRQAVAKHQPAVDADFDDIDDLPEPQILPQILRAAEPVPVSNMVSVEPPLLSLQLAPKPARRKLMCQDLPTTRPGLQTARRADGKARLTGKNRSRSASMDVETSVVTRGREVPPNKDAPSSSPEAFEPPQRAIPHSPIPSAEPPQPETQKLAPQIPPSLEDSIPERPRSDTIPIHVVSAPPVAKPRTIGKPPDPAPVRPPNRPTRPKFPPSKDTVPAATAAQMPDRPAPKKPQASAAAKAAERVKLVEKQKQLAADSPPSVEDMCDEPAASSQLTADDASDGSEDGNTGFPDTGPWTIEAWDLFGWLPPGRKDWLVGGGAHEAAS